MAKSTDENEVAGADDREADLFDSLEDMVERVQYGDGSGTEIADSSDDDEEDDDD